MKNVIILLRVFVFSFLLFTGCGETNTGNETKNDAIGVENPMDNDAKIFGEMTCQYHKLMEKDSRVLTDSQREELNKLDVDLTNLENEMKGKYPSETEYKEFKEAYLKILDECIEASGTDN